jgi:hypothetical protein
MKSGAARNSPSSKRRRKSASWDIFSNFLLAAASWSHNCANLENGVIG